MKCPCALRALSLSLLLIVLPVGAAENPSGPRTGPRLLQLEQAYARADREQQAAYQQFMMAQELRRNELMSELPGTGLGPTYRAPGAIDSRPSIDYDENLRRQSERQERLYRLERDIASAYSRYQELGVQKQSLQEQMRALTPGR